MKHCIIDYDYNYTIQHIQCQVFGLYTIQFTRCTRIVSYNYPSLCTVVAIRVSVTSFLYFLLLVGAITLFWVCNHF